MHGLRDLICRVDKWRRGFDWSHANLPNGYRILTLCTPTMRIELHLSQLADPNRWHEELELEPRDIACDRDDAWFGLPP